MVFGLLGVAGMFLGLLTVGAIMEHDKPKAVKFGAATLVCAAIIVAWGPKGGSPVGGEDCYIDWDGRSNPMYCPPE